MMRHQCTNLMRITSINIGRRETITIGNNVLETGIYKKYSVDSGKINENGFTEDVIADTTSHGGRDQAVYLYSLEDYAWWSEELQTDLPAGTFGENLTVSSFGASPLKIGDRLQIDNVLLEVTFARTIADRMGQLSGAITGDPSLLVESAPTKNFSLPKSNADVREILSHTLQQLQVGIRAYGDGTVEG
jgi:hypothetical protein